MLSQLRIYWDEQKVDLDLGPQCTKLTTDIQFEISTSIVMFREDTVKHCEVPLTPRAARLNVSLQPSAISCWWSRVIYLNIGRQSSDSPIRTAVCNMEILLFNKPGTESANNNYLCTLQIPLLLIWKDEICNKSMFKLFLIQTSTSTRQQHFCMNEN